MASLTFAASVYRHPAGLAATGHRLLVLPDVCNAQRCSCDRSYVPGLVGSDKPADLVSQAPKALEDLTGLTELHASAAAYDPGRDDSDDDAETTASTANDDDAWTSI